MQQPLKHIDYYGLTGRPYGELAIYLDAIANGLSPENAEQDVETWILVADDGGTRAVSEFLLANGVSKDSLTTVTNGHHLYVVAQVPVPLLIQLSEHPHARHVGDRIPTEVEPRDPSLDFSPTPTPTPTPSGAAGTAQEPLKPVQKYGLTGPPFFELDIYLDAVARGVTPENANKKVETWIRVRDDAGLRSVSEFLLANGVSEDSLRTEQHGRHFRYVIAQVPVPLLIPLSAHPDALHVGDRIPTEVEKEVAPTGSNATPAPTATSTATATPITPWEG